MRIKPLFAFDALSPLAGSSLKVKTAERGELLARIPPNILQKALILFSIWNEVHSPIPQVIFEAIPKDETDQARRYRGYIALDDVNFKSGSHCRGHCTFDAGLCGFKNSDRADFDWSVVSGVNAPRNLVSEFGPVPEADERRVAAHFIA